MWDDSAREHQESQISDWGEYSTLQLYELDMLRDRHPYRVGPAGHIDLLLEASFAISIGFFRRDRMKVQADIGRAIHALGILQKWVDSDDFDWRYDSEF